MSIDQELFKVENDFSNEGACINEELIVIAGSNSSNLKSLSSHGSHTSHDSGHTSHVSHGHTSAAGKYLF